MNNPHLFLKRTKDTALNVQAVVKKHSHGKTPVYSPWILREFVKCPYRHKLQPNGHQADILHPVPLWLYNPLPNRQRSKRSFWRWGTNLSNRSGVSDPECVCRTSNEWAPGEIVAQTFSQVTAILTTWDFLFSRGQNSGFLAKWQKITYNWGPYRSCRSSTAPWIHKDMDSCSPFAIPTKWLSFSLQALLLPSVTSVELCFCQGGSSKRG